jgi:predicted metallo-beta-lactamase superfamily hydrolase
VEVRLLACESFGVRSLATAVRTRDHVYLIDPGVSVPPRRSKLPPHPFELAASFLARERIMSAAAEADTIVLTHYHHDHFTPFHVREHEWSDTEEALRLYRGRRLWAKSPRHHLNPNQRRRAATIEEHGLAAEEADGREFGDVRFSPAVPHGEVGNPRGCVVMALFQEEGGSFAFASDVQLLNDQAVEVLLSWQPAACLLSGPPVYLDVISPEDRRRAAERARALSRAIPTLVVDHHLTRTMDYGAWLDPIADEATARGHTVCAGAAFAGRAPLLLEGRRKELFRRWPVTRSYLPELTRGDEATRAWLIELARKLEASGTIEEVPY